MPRIIRTLWIILIYILIAPLAMASNREPVIVLVPGFFNSLSVDPYFSKAILQTLQARGLDVLAVDNLDPIGSVEENGLRLNHYLNANVSRFPNRNLVVIGHSAGGLYTLQALTNDPSLPVQTLISIGTPFTGVQFIDRLTSRIPGLESLASFLHLASLREFTAEKMLNVTQRFRVPSHLRLITVAGYQEACFLTSCTTSRNLSWILSIAQRLMSEKSDGVVTVRSALAEGLILRGWDGQPFPIERWDDFLIPLEHWELVQEGRWFKTLGITDTAEVSALQARTFNWILDRLEPALRAQ